MKKARRKVVERSEQEEEKQEQNKGSSIFDGPPVQNNKKEIKIQHTSINDYAQSYQKRQNKDKKTNVLTVQSEQNRQVSQKYEINENSDRDQKLILPNSQIKMNNNTSNTQVNSSISSEKLSQEDQKKKRIELLKQKYLKKGSEQKVQIPKTQEKNISQKIQNKIQNISAQIRKQIEKKEVNIQNIKIKSINMESKSQILLSSKQQASPENGILQRQQSSNLQNTSKASAEDKKNSNRIPPPPPPSKNIGKIKVPPSIGILQSDLKQKPKQIKNETETQILKNSQVKQSGNTVNVNNIPPPPPSKGSISKNLPLEKTEIKKQQTKEIKFEQLQPPITENKSKVVQNKNKQKQLITSNKNLSLLQKINLWINNPIQHLLDIFESIKKQNKIFNFKSKNINFTNLLNNFLIQFVVNNRNELNENQKNILYQFCNQYFKESDKQITQPQCIILVKLGQKYLSSYNIQKILKILPIVYQNKHIFISSELISFVDYILNTDLSYTHFLQLLLISPTDKLVHSLANKNITQIDTIIKFLAAIQLQRINYPILISPYLKLISNLLQNLPQIRSNQVQTILNHFKQLQVNEKNYQLHKQIKLKMIDLITKSNSPQKQQAKLNKPQDKNETGLVGIWGKSIINTFKTVTNQLVDTKEVSKKQTKGQKQQAEDNIVYDPVLKRYLINGKVPDDEDGRKVEETSTSKAPPPPKPLNKNVPPPPAKKGRIPTNRYT